MPRYVPREIYTTDLVQGSLLGAGRGGRGEGVEAVNEGAMRGQGGRKGEPRTEREGVGIKETEAGTVRERESRGSRGSFCWQTPGTWLRQVMM